MTIKFEKIQPGMTLWTKERRRMGNTTLRETVAVEYRVTVVNADDIVVYRNGRVVALGRRRAERLSAKNPTCTECRRVGSHKMDCSKRRAR